MFINFSKTHVTLNILKSAAGEDESRGEVFKEKSNLVMFFQGSLVRVWRRDPRGARREAEN